MEPLATDVFLTGISSSCHKVALRHLIEEVDLNAHLDYGQMNWKRTATL